MIALWSLFEYAEINNFPKTDEALGGLFDNSMSGVNSGIYTALLDGVEQIFWIEELKIWLCC